MTRKEFWDYQFARAPGTPELASRWADEALALRDARFPEEEPKPKSTDAKDYVVQCAVAYVSAHGEEPDRWQNLREAVRAYLRTR